MSQSPDAPRFVDPAQRYRLGSRIATGGMGEVWRAEDTVLGRSVAVKLLKTEYADDASFRTRFESEARNAAALHHPNVASVFDFGELPPSEGFDAPRPYLVMELVDGRPLSDLIRRDHPMDPGAMRDLLAQAADAIGAAHAAGIVHRDVKPANLLVTPDRRVKITDFGIARATEGMALTQTGQVMGTPQYLSPEQAQGRGASPASDVYSLGVVAFECLAGHRPFEADSPVATALAHVRDPVPDLPDDVPADLAAVVYKSMEKEPADRFADGRELATALRDPATAATMIAGAGPGDRTSVLPGAAAGAGLGAAAGAAAGYAAGRGGDAGPATRGIDPQASGTGGPGTTTSTTSARGAGDDRPRSNPVWVWVLLALAAVLVAVLLLTRLGGDDQPDDDPARTPSESPSQTEEPSQEPTPEPTQEQPTQEPTPDEPSEEPSEEPTPEPSPAPSSPAPSSPDTLPSSQDPTDAPTSGAPSSTGGSPSAGASPSVARAGDQPGEGGEAGDRGDQGGPAPGAASPAAWRGDR